eukprot:jgi/Picre1/33921/NNA_001400.t1
MEHAEIVSPKFVTNAVDPDIAIPDGLESPLAPLSMHDSVDPEMEHAEMVLPPTFVTNTVDPDIAIPTGIESSLAPLSLHDSVDPEMEHAEIVLPPKFVTNAVDPDIAIPSGPKVHWHHCQCMTALTQRWSMQK